VILCAAPAVGQTPGQVTDVRILAPLSQGRLASGLTAAGAPANGECFAASLASQGRSDAWRCMAGNIILDPCFESAPPGPGPLACVASPWVSRVRLFKLAKPVPRDQANDDSGRLTAKPPWALELADGSRCTFLTGATWQVAGLRANYGCTNGAAVFGDVDRGAPLWRVFVQHGPAGVIRRTAVLVAWY
jgi:hypothetical protein